MSAEVYERTGTHPYPLAVREPGATLAAPVPHAPRPGQADLLLLGRARDGLKRLPRGDEPIYGAVTAERYGTGPQPSFTPAPPPPSPAEDLARYRLADLVYAAARRAEPPYGAYCPDCKADPSGRCPDCSRARARAAALDRLHALVLAAGTYAAAAVLVATADLAPETATGGGR